MGTTIIARVKARSFIMTDLEAEVVVSFMSEQKG